MVKFLQVGDDWVNVEHITWVHFFPGHNNIPTCTVHFGEGHSRDYVGDQAEAVQIFVQQNRVGHPPESQVDEAAVPSPT